MLIYLHVAGSSAVLNTVYLKTIWMRGSERDPHLGLGKQNLRVRLKKLCVASVCSLVGPNTCACAALLLCRLTSLCLCVCFDERERMWKGQEMTGSQVESPVADSTPFSFYYQITRDKQLWQSAKVGPAGKELWWKRRRSPRCGKHPIINATCVAHFKSHPYMTQSSVCHFEIWQGGHHHRPPHHQKRCYTWATAKRKCWVTTQSIQSVTYEAMCSGKASQPWWWKIIPRSQNVSVTKWWCNYNSCRYMPAQR